MQLKKEHELKRILLITRIRYAIEKGTRIKANFTNYTN
jgi:hypothetical protein